MGFAAMYHLVSFASGLFEKLDEEGQNEGTSCSRRHRRRCTGSRETPNPSRQDCRGSMAFRCNGLASGSNASNASNTVIQSNIRVQNEQDKVKFSMDIPGVRVEDLKIQVENRNELVISGKRRTSPASSSSSSSPPEFTRRIILNESILTDQISANLSHGVLVVIAAKKPKPAPIVVDVTTDPSLLVEEPVAEAPTTTNGSSDDDKSNEAEQEVPVNQEATIQVEDVPDHEVDFIEVTQL